MPEPTIDELLEWFHQVRERVRIAEREPYLHRPAYFDAIRAILEQHRALEKHYEQLDRVDRLMKESQLEAIRAFVERVQAKWHTKSGVMMRYDTLDEELAAREKE